MADSVAIAQLVGFILFSVGSAFFVWMAWADEWLLPWRIGCAIWIGGCFPYLWPPMRDALRNECTGMATRVSGALQVAAMLSWAVGSGYAFIDDEDLALAVNSGGYLAGSVCLLCDAILQARQFRSATPITRIERASLVGDLLAGLFYTLAGVFGGYASEVALLQFGNVCWLVGSLISGVRPCLALCATGCARPKRKSVELEEANTSTTMSASAI